MRPEDVPEDMVVAATMALTGHGLEFYQVEPLIRGITGRVPPHGLRAAIAAVAPLIQAAERERCARVADEAEERCSKAFSAAVGSEPTRDANYQRSRMAFAIASAIRAMKDTP